MSGGGRRPRLVVITGLPGSGKTTLARALAAELGAVRMCPDDWMAIAGIDLWDADARARIEALQHDLAMATLSGGRDVVIEWGTWTRAERDELREAAQAVGASVELRALAAPVDELHRRIEARQEAGEWMSRPITRADLETWVDAYEVPAPDELATYDASVPAHAPPGVTRWEGPGLEAWEAWTPEEVAGVLRDLAVPWCVVGGWAIDLFLGRRTRPHDDLEIAVLRGDFAAVRSALAGFELFSVGDGEVVRLPDEASPPPDRHQTWVLDPTAGRWRVDVMLENGDADTWVFRRDPSVAAPRARMVRTGAGAAVPYLSPAGVLLYKAKSARPKDEQDLESCLPVLPAQDRHWLRAALDATHPGHPWIDRLAAGG